MKALFIWREESAKTLINKSISYVAEDKNRKQKLDKYGKPVKIEHFKDGFKVVTSNEQLNDLLPKADFLGLSKQEINKQKKENTKKQKTLDSYSNIYILAELNWEENGIFTGYEVLLKLMKIWKSNGAPCIQVYSVENREKVRELIDDRYKFLVTALPPVDLLSFSVPIKFPAKKMNLALWQSIKYMSLTSFGVLDTFTHRLETLNENSNSFKTQLEVLVAEMRSYTSLLGNEIIQKLNVTEFTAEYVAKLKQLIGTRIIEIIGDKVTRTDLPKSMKILVIDDNPIELQIIKTSMERYKENLIQYTTSGSEALALIKEDVFDMIISDLELLDEDGFYQEIQGIHLFEEVEKTKTTVFGIITGLGRKGISKLLHIEDKLILPKKHLKNFNVDEEIDGLLKNMLIEFTKKEKTLDLEYGPKKGIINKSGFKKALSKFFSDDNFYKSTWGKAREIASNFINRTLEPHQWNKEIKKGASEVYFDDFISLKLSTLLGQRLIMIFLSVKNEGWILFEEEDYKDILDANSINITKNWINTLCIKYDKEVSDKGFLLSIKELFPEELVFLNEMQESYKKEKSKFLVSYHSPKTIEWLNRILDVENSIFQGMNVPIDISDWEYSDLNTIWLIILNDFKNKKSNSDYFDILELLLDCPASVLMEIKPILQEFERQLQKLGEISMDWNV